MSATRPACEALAQAVLERLQVAGRAIGGEHDLPAAVVQRVEGVEELLLGLGLALEELDVVEEQDVDVAEAGLEAVGVTVAERVEELVGEGLAGGAADGQARAVREQQACDRAQQVGLADAGRPADEQRVVGLRRHLGDGQRGGVREAVGVADDELLEGQLRVAERPAERVELEARRRVRSRGARGATRRARRERGSRPSRTSGEARAARDRLAAGDELDDHVWAEHQRDARVEHPSEAPADPRAGVLGGFDRQALVRRARASPQGLEPDAVRGLVDGECQLSLHARPYVLQLGAHGSVYPLLPRRKWWSLFERGPAGSPVRRL